MTIELFIYLFTIGSAVSSLITQAAKKNFDELPSNFLALGSAIIVGVGGTAVAYSLLAMEYNRNNIICMLLMAICIWVGSMVGYDKVVQLIGQFKGGAHG